MKQKLRFSIYFLFILGCMMLSPSCKTKEGCGQQEMYNNPDMETQKKGKSNLFSKSQNKKMKTRN